MTDLVVPKRGKHDQFILWKRQSSSSEDSNILVSVASRKTHFGVSLLDRNQIWYTKNTASLCHLAHELNRKTSGLDMNCCKKNPWAHNKNTPAFLFLLQSQRTKFGKDFKTPIHCSETYCLQGYSSVLL